MSRTKDDRVTELLKSIPRREASPAFTEEVLKRLDNPQRSGLGGRRLIWVTGTAAAVLLVALTLGLWRWQQHSERRHEAERVETLRTEYRELKAEVERLQSLARDLDPVLELGGTDRVDFVFDLRELAKENNRTGIQPVSHGSGEKR
jgi:hypothetical protein